MAKTNSKSVDVKLEPFAKFTKKKVCMGKEIDVAYRKLPSERPVNGAAAAKARAEGREPIFLFDGFGNKPALNPRTYEAAPGIICEQDVCIVMRDGTKTYADIFRPVGAEKVPVIISWSWFGKRNSNDDEDTVFQTYGVPYGSYSKNAKFEGPDPEYWCYKGYAICNYDFRGVNNSEGDIEMCTRQLGRDGYDVVEWLAAQPWCNGNVGMSGTSGLACAQWDTAAENPPHLACIAPWEGVVDTYRELISIGGIPECGFNPYLVYSFYGLGDMDDHYENTKLHPFHDEYWKEKVAKLDNITCPAYITAGWQHFHLRGSTDGYQQISSKQKWIRIHRDFEWADYYSHEALTDLTLFFDRYLKGIRNGWESTPTVRIDVMDAYDYDFQLQRGEENFPLPRTQYKKLWLDASKRSMGEQAPAVTAKCSYDAMRGHSTFDIKFDEDTELTGYMKLHAWVEAEGNDDADIFLTIQKLDADGKFIPCNIIGAPHPGSTGRLRVSMREIDEEKATFFRPQHTYAKSEKLTKGQIVPVDIEIWPLSRIWHKGEQLRLDFAGHYFREDWFEPFDYDTVNVKGSKTIIHTGGEYDSYLQIPVIPPKYVSGSYVYR